MMKYLYSVLIFLFLLTNGIVNGQNIIEGEIIDNNSDPLPFANIVLYQGEDFISGAVSDDNGSYVFENLSPGNYYLEVSVIGYKMIKSDPIKLKESPHILNFNMIEDAHELGEVVIKSKRPTFKQTAEKLVLILENSELVSTNLEDVMKRIPGVIVTNNGISLAGQSDITILINGKSTDYMDIDALMRDFPADNIAKIELIEQPGAEYDASGSGPIINIILKKNVKLGTHGFVKGWIGEDEGVEYGASTSIASYKDKLNWQASVNYSEPTWREDLSINRKVGNSSTYDQETISPFAPKSIQYSGAVHYYLNDYHTVGVNGSYRTNKSVRFAIDNTTIIENGIKSILNTKNHYERNRVVFNVNPYYEYDNEKHKLTLDFNYVDYTNDNINNITGLAGNTVPYNNLRYFQDGTYNIMTYKGDYKYTLSDDFSISIGSKYAHVNTDNDLKIHVENEAGTFIFDPSQSNRFLVDETIFANYAKLNLMQGNWTFSGGLRHENSITNGTSKSDNKTKERVISKLFPSVSVSRKIVDKLAGNLSYSHRIRRPSYNSLNNFVYYYNPTTSKRGNPNLKPAFTDKFQFNLTYDGSPFFTIAYSKTDDALMELITQNDESGHITGAMDNLDVKENWNFRAFGPLSFLKGLGGYTGFIVDYSKIRKQYDNDQKVELSKWSLMWYTNIQYELPWKIKTEITGWYSTGPLEGQFDMDWLANLDFGMSKKFLDEKLKVHFGVRKILNRQYNGVMEFANVNASFISGESKQNVYMQVTYNFGSKFGKKKDKTRSSIEEEQRINDNN